MTTVYEHYQACVIRGHDADTYITTGLDETRGQCRYCKTWFWTETITHEQGAPAPDQQDSDG